MKKKPIIITILLVSVFTIATVFIVAQNRNEGQVPADQINRSIQTFSRLLTPETVQSFGVNSIDEFKTLKPGKQFRKFMITLEDVRNFKAESPVNSIIKQLDAVEVTLVNQSGQVQSSIGFVLNNGKWEAGAFGLSPDLSRFKNAQRSLGDVQIDSMLFITIPALQSTFLMKGQGPDATFIILENNDRLQFKVGSSIPASEAIQRLKGAANEYNGLPQ